MRKWILDQLKEIITNWQKDCKMVYEGFRMMVNDLTSIEFWLTVGKAFKEIAEILYEFGKWLLKSRRFLRFLLLVLFILNTGIVSKYLEATSGPKSRFRAEPYRYIPYAVAGSMGRLEEFIKPIEAEAKQRMAKGEYSLEAFMADLNRIYQYEQEKLGYPAGQYSHRLVDELWEAARKHNWKDIRQAQTKHLEAYDEADLVKHLKNREIPWWIKLGSVMFWFLIFYLKNLPMAAALYVLWLYEARLGKKRKFYGLTPGSVLWFLLLVPAYPIVIPYFWLKAMFSYVDDLALQTEIRRRKRKLFSFLSPYEKRLIKRFSNKRRGRELLQLELARKGRVIRHSLVAAMLTTLVMLMLEWVIVFEQQVVVYALVLEIGYQVDLPNEADAVMGQKKTGPGMNILPPLRRLILSLPPLISRWLHSKREFWLKWLIPFPIDHVPIRQLVY